MCFGMFREFRRSNADHNRDKLSENNSENNREELSEIELDVPTPTIS